MKIPASWITGARTLYTIGVAALAAAAATAERWLNPDSDSTVVHLSLYVLDIFRWEILAGLVLLGALILPNWIRGFVTRWKTRISRLSLAQVNAIRRYRWRRVRWQCVIGTLLFITVSISFAAPLLYSLAHLERAKVALALKYYKGDFLRYLSDQARTRIESRDIDGAKKYYLSILKFYGNGETTASVSDQLRKIESFEQYSARLSLRAAEIERDSGTNPRSMYLYLEALQFRPQSDGVVTSISAYIPIIEALEGINNQVNDHCSGRDALSDQQINLDGQELKTVASFATSEHAKNLLRLGVSASTPSEQAAFWSQACSYSKNFGSIVQRLAGYLEPISNVVNGPGTVDVDEDK